MCTLTGNCFFDHGGKCCILNAFFVIEMNKYLLFYSKWKFFRHYMSTFFFDSNFCCPKTFLLCSPWLSTNIFRVHLNEHRSSILNGWLSILFLFSPWKPRLFGLNETRSLIRHENHYFFPNMSTFVVVYMNTIFRPKGKYLLPYMKSFSCAMTAILALEKNTVLLV